MKIFSKLLIACLFFLNSSLWAAQAFSSGKKLQIVCLGDSLTAGYGVEKDKAYPKLLEQKIQAKLKVAGKEEVVEVINAGVSGSTTASGHSRLSWILKKSKPQVLILALGANDGLRGLKLAQSQKHLEEIVELAKENKMKVLLGAMRLPPNYGKEYTQNFRKMYLSVRDKYDLKMVPFMLEDVGGEKDLNIEDGIHPNAKGHQIVADHVMKYLAPLIGLEK